jgi:hypothetical protein
MEYVESANHDEETRCCLIPMLSQGMVKVFSSGRRLRDLSVHIWRGSNASAECAASQEDTWSSYLTCNYPRRPANNKIISRLPPTRSSITLSKARCSRYGGPQEEGPICGRGVRIRSQCWRSTGCGSCPASSTRLWRACAVIRGSIAGIWSSGAWLWDASGPGLRTASTARSQCSQPAVWSDELGASARPGCSSSTATHGRHTTEPIVPLRPHRPTLSRVGAVQPASAHPSSFQRRGYALRVRQRIE